VTKKQLNQITKDIRWVLKSMKIEIDMINKAMNKLDRGVVDKTSKLGKR
jgi:hypothetical protein